MKWFRKKEIWEIKNPKKAIKVVEQTNDQHILAKVIELSEYADVKSAACKRLGHVGDSCICNRCGGRHFPSYLVKHDWDSCICKRCGEKRYSNYKMVSLATEEGVHDWNGCVCKRCGAKRYAVYNTKLHNAVSVADTKHDWNGCVCKRCGTIRYGEDVLDFYDIGGYRIAREGEEHDWNGCVCRRCYSSSHIWKYLGTSTIVRVDYPDIHARREDKEDSYYCSRCGKMKKEYPG